MKYKRKRIKKISVIFLLFFAITLSSCLQKPKGNAQRFKQGLFKIPEGKGYSKTIITRVDSLQIEEYEKIINLSSDSSVIEKRIKRIDTLFIKWKNNFAYTLKMKNPKTSADKDVIFVQITKVTDSSYNFSAKIGRSNYKQDGIVYKIK